MSALSSYHLIRGRGWGEKHHLVVPASFTPTGPAYCNRLPDHDQEWEQIGPFQGELSDPVYCGHCRPKYLRAEQAERDRRG